MTTKNLFSILVLNFFFNVFIFGQSSVVLSTPNSSGQNAFVGVRAGSVPNVPFVTNDFNSFVGYEAGRYNTGIGYNAFFGWRAGMNSTSGSGNVFLGGEAGFGNTTGGNNVFIGRLSGFTNVLGGQLNTIPNTYIGFRSGDNTNGNQNVYLGAFAGSCASCAYNFPNNNNGNVFLGAFAGFGYNVNNTLVISSAPNGNSPSPLIYGEFDNKKLKFNVNKGTSPSFLELNGNANSSGLRFTNLTSALTTPSPSNGKVLTVNATGDVVLTTDQGAGTITSISNGTNITIAGNGTPATPYTINSSNIYTNNGSLTENRTMDIKNFNLTFNNAGSTDGGNIYIGNVESFPNTTGNYNLYVEGGILTEKVKVALRNTANWADFVFDKDYQLMPLSDVETFILKNKHLPSVSSSVELIKEGLDLAEMQAKQMQKIEELTLYAIEQNKKLELQSKQIEKLKLALESLLDRK